MWGPRKLLMGDSNAVVLYYSRLGPSSNGKARWWGIRNCKDCCDGGGREQRDDGPVLDAQAPACVWLGRPFSNPNRVCKKSMCSYPSWKEKSHNSDRQNFTNTHLPTLREQICQIADTEIPPITPGFATRLVSETGCLDNRVEMLVRSSLSLNSIVTRRRNVRERDSEKKEHCARKQQPSINVIITGRSGKTHMRIL